jgi:hypothetical protein
MPVYPGALRLADHSSRIVESAAYPMNGEIHVATIRE